jgi:hypothetical protein
MPIRANHHRQGLRPVTATATEATAVAISGADHASGSAKVAITTTPKRIGRKRMASAPSAMTSGSKAMSTAGTKATAYSKAMPTCAHQDHGARPFSDVGRQVQNAQAPIASASTSGNHPIRTKPWNNVVVQAGGAARKQEQRL